MVMPVKWTPNIKYTNTSKQHSNPIQRALLQLPCDPASRQQKNYWNWAYVIKANVASTTPWGYSLRILDSSRWSSWWKRWKWKRKQNNYYGKNRPSSLRRVILYLHIPRTCFSHHPPSQFLMSGLARALQVSEPCHTLHSSSLKRFA